MYMRSNLKRKSRESVNSIEEIDGEVETDFACTEDLYLKTIRQKDEMSKSPKD